MVLIHGFEQQQQQEIPELNIHATLYRHIQSGASLLSLVNQDENKVFGITFRTPPDNSTGIAHIIEHCVLCGSQKYPLKEPFIELVKGSLKTFLNASTYPDKTCYPVASQNIQDFYNLIDVYVDAVFHPLIPPETFQQEGWHLELDDLEAPLNYKGVVFNEMKGAYSNPDDVLQDAVRMSLFPDTPYGVDLGGDPRHIPDLTYHQFKSFHEKYYHPANARIYFYGNDDPEERLRRMDLYLSGYERIQVDSGIPLQASFSEPRRMEISFDPGEDVGEMKGMLVMNWLLPEIQDPEMMLALTILIHVLIGAPASPLRKALIDSGYGEDLAGIGLEVDLRQAYFSIGLKGMQADPRGKLISAEQVEALIQNTLQELAREGIDPDTVAASLNTVEFQLRENNTGSFPQGLLLMLRSLTNWLYDRDPFVPLAFENPLASIKNRVQAGDRFFEGLISRFLLGNPHQTVVSLKPEHGLQKQRDKDERDRLAQIRSGMSLEALAGVLEQTRKLKEIQERPDPPEMLSRIPSLKLDDLDRENKRIPLEIAEIEDSQVFYHDLFTNGILYLDLGFDLHTLSQDLLPFVSLFGRALLEMGTQREDYVQLSQRIGRSTGGIWPASFTSSIRGTDYGAARLFLRSKAAIGQAGELAAILQDILLTARLDNQERFLQIALEEKASAESMLSPAGHVVVNTRLRSLFNEADWAAEQMSGIEQLFHLRSLVKQINENWPVVQERLEEVRKVLLNRQTMVVNVTLDAVNWAGFKPLLNDFLSQIPSKNTPTAVWQPSHASNYEGLVIPTQVSYVGKGANLFDLGYIPDGSIDVIKNYLKTTWLWERVRVQGGAYGGFCVFNHRSGVFTYLSYRDPNLLKTLENYDLSAKFLSRLEMNPEELTKSIIGAIGEMDAYTLPDAKGYSSTLRYLAGDTDESRQIWREQILSTTSADFRSFGDVLHRLNESGFVVVMGSQEALSKANSERNNWLDIKKIL